MKKSWCWPLLLCLWFFSSMLWASTPRWTGIELIQFAQTAGNPDIIYAAANPGIFKSEDRGKSWSPLKLPQLVTYPQVVVDLADARHVMVLPHENSVSDVSRSAGFFESRDGGLTWQWRVVLNQSHIDSIHAVSRLSQLKLDTTQDGGAWWGVVGQQLFRSDDRGQSWSPDSRPPYMLNAKRSGGWLFALNGDTLLRSSDAGASWQAVRQFEPGGKNRLATATNLLVLDDGRLILRHQQQWLESLDQGDSWQAATEGWAHLPDVVSPGTDARLLALWSTSCQVMPAGASGLLASCITGNGSMPGRLCLKRSEDMGRSWTALGPRCHIDDPKMGLPTRWNPLSIHVDVSDPNILLASWMAGGVYRSEDGGRTWVHADQALLFPSDRGWDISEAEYAALHEPALHRAVLLRDWTAFKQLLSMGTDINAAGNYLGSLLETDLKAAVWRARSGQAADSMYFDLRQNGALIHDIAQTELFLAASQADLPEVMQDLIELGYDWGRVGRNTNATELSKAFNLSVNKQGLSAYPVDAWIDTYIKANKFPSADRTVADIFSKRPDLGLRVLKAATQKTVFDRQPGLNVNSRHAVLLYLLANNQIFWAKRVLEVLPPDGNLTNGKKILLTMENFQNACDPVTLGWFERHGAVFLSYDDCLLDSKHTAAQRLRFLDWLGRVINQYPLRVEGLRRITM